MQAATTDDLTTRGAVAEVWRIAWPTVLTMVSYTIMQFVDAAMVAQLGPVEVAAQGNGGVWSWAVIFSVVGVLTVVNTFVSQAVGARRPHEVARYAWGGVWLGVIAWVVLLVPLGFALPLAFALMGHSPRMTELESGYATILVLGSVVTVVGKAMSNFFFGIQRPRVIAVAAIAGNVVNVLLNYALIYGEEGLPSMGLPGVPGCAAMGVPGAALATVIGTAVEASVPAALFLGRRMDREYGIRRAWRPDVAAMRDLVRLGAPASLQQGSEILTWAIFMTVLVGRFGDVALSAGWSTQRYLHLSFMPAVGFSIAATSLVGRHIGAGRPDLAVSRARVALAIAVAYMGACAVLMLAFRGPMISIFASGARTSPEVAAQVIEVGSSLMVAAALFQVFDAVGIVILGALRGAGDTLWPGLVTVFLSWTIIVGGGWLVTEHAPQLGPLGPWIAAGVYIAVLAGVLGFRWKRGAWRAIRILETPEEEAARAR
ncbi:MAG: MATE family efflux transporter [Phycisphaerales bacterium]